MMRWSDERLKKAVEQVSDALSALRELDTHTAPDPDDDTEGHRFFSDERLKEAVEPLRNSLPALLAVRVTRS